MKSAALLLIFISVLNSCTSPRVLTEKDEMEVEQSQLTSASKISRKVKPAGGFKIQGDYKTINIHGINFKGHVDIDESKFHLASDITDMMLAHVPGIKKRLTENQYLVYLIKKGTSLTDSPDYSDWKGKTFHQYTKGKRNNDDLQGVTENFICAATEESLDNDRNNVLIHEFGHVIMAYMDREDINLIKSIYDDALRKRTYVWNEYCMENSREYWAVLTEVWFQEREPAGIDRSLIRSGASGLRCRQLNRTDLNIVDPKIVAVLTRIYGERK